MAAKQNEALVIKKIKQIIAECGGWCFKTQGTIYGKNGVPDIVAVVNGWPVFIEAKSGRGRPTRLQLVQLDRIRQAGGMALLVNEQNLSELKVLLTALATSSMGRVWSPSPDLVKPLLPPPPPSTSTG